MKKVLVKLLSVIICLSVIIGVCVLPTTAIGDPVITSSGKSLLSRDYTLLTTTQFMKIVKALRTLKYLITGKKFWGDTSDFNVEIDPELEELLEYISDNSVLDINELLTTLPDINDPAKLAAAIFEIDTAAFRDEMYELSLQFKEDGDEVKEEACHLIGVYFSGIESAYVYLEQLDNGDLRVCIKLTYTDGGTEVIHPNIYINPETGEAYGKNGKGMIKTGFNCSIYELMTYAPMYCWMRDFGFCIEYDFLCYLLPIFRYNTRRFKFNYEDKEWMLQVWKGNYLITNGAEAGLYNREPSRFGSFYDTVSDEDRVPMSLTLMHDDNVILHREEELHWWVNGFRIANNKLYAPENLTMILTVEVKDEEMLEALCTAIDNNMHKDVAYTVDGLDITITW